MTLLVQDSEQVLATQKEGILSGIKERIFERIGEQLRLKYQGQSAQVDAIMATEIGRLFATAVAISEAQHRFAQIKVMLVGNGDGSLNLRVIPHDHWVIPFKNYDELDQGLGYYVLVYRLFQAYLDDNMELVQEIEHILVTCDSYNEERWKTISEVVGEILGSDFANLKRVLVSVVDFDDDRGDWEEVYG
jgi:hypothetical protein